jgi:hypothetical protein
MDYMHGRNGMAMREIELREFTENAAETLNDARYEPVAITEDGKRRLVIMSIEVFESMRRGSRRVLHVSEMTEDDIREIADSKMPEGLEHLDSELDES